MAYPSALTTLPDTTAGEVLGTAGGGIGISAYLDFVGVDLLAIETKIGTGSATPALNKVLVGDGTGTSTWTATLAGLTLTTPSMTTPLVTNGIVDISGANGILRINANTDGGEYNIGVDTTGTLAVFGSGAAVLNVSLLDGTLKVVSPGNATTNVLTTDATQTVTNKTLSTGSVIDTNVTVTEVLKKVYPIGCIYFSVNSTNPATSLGFGTWSAFGAGRVPVGFDSGQTEFDTDEETGGAKTHTLTTTEMPSHTHTQDAHQHTETANSGVGVFGAAGGSGMDGAATVNTGATAATNQNTGGGGAHNNLQPYIVVRMYKRTA